MRLHDPSLDENRTVFALEVDLPRTASSDPRPFCRKGEKPYGPAGPVDCQSASKIAPRSASKIGSDSNLMKASILCAGEREKLDLVAPHRRPSGRSEASASDNRPKKPAGRQTGVPFIKSASEPNLDPPSYDSNRMRHLANSCFRTKTIGVQLRPRHCNKSLLESTISAKRGRDQYSTPVHSANPPSVPGDTCWRRAHEGSSEAVVATLSAQGRLFGGQSTR